MERRDHARHAPRSGWRPPRPLSSLDRGRLHGTTHACHPAGRYSLCGAARERAGPDWRRVTPMRILFVCTGNTCPSVMAEAIARRLVQERGLTDVEVGSAGTAAWAQAPASDGALLVCMERDTDISPHQARLATKELLDEYDLVLAMGPHHVERLEALGGRGKVFLLSQYASRCSRPAHWRPLRRRAGAVPGDVRRAGCGDPARAGSHRGRAQSWRVVTVRPRRLVLLGHPVSHSLSPVFQNAALQSAGVPIRYEALDVEPGDLRETLRGLVDEGAAGNVTIPHKEAVAAVCDRLTPLADRVGAVNTFWVDDSGDLVGDNTDVAGFAHLAIGVLGEHPGHLRVTVLGAGGAAAAVLAAVEQWPDCHVVLAGRSGRRLRNLAHRFRIVQAVCRDTVQSVRDAQVIVNATPVGQSDASLPT